MRTLALLLLITFAFSYKIKQNKSHSKNVRIIGGNSAKAGEFPFAAAIYVTTKDSRHFCAGSLIDSEWILTAGQCVNGAISFTIKLGSNLLDGADSNRVTVSSTEYFIHPDFDPETFVNDVALIKLRLPVTYTDYVSRIFLAYGNLSDYTDLVAIGWGQTSDTDSELSNELQYVNVAAVSNNECKLIYGDQISDNMVCVAGEYNEGTCIGDTGGALIHHDFASRSSRHVGTSSFISGNGCESTDPSGFTRTYSYKQWITNVTGIIS